jgi:DNA-binding PadR family transcriptional regulator
MIFRSLYPALHCMGQSGWISSECALFETSRTSKYYLLTLAGEMELDNAAKSFE